MRKSLEERIVSFTIEFVKAVAKINEDLIYEDYSMRYGKEILAFVNITWDKVTVQEWLRLQDDPLWIRMGALDEDGEESVQEFTGNDNCVAYMMCEGELYEKMYGYSAYQEDIFGGGNEAKKLYDALYRIADKYGLWFEWADGALIFYDDAYAAINNLLKYEFYDGEKTECPIVVVGPDGGKQKAKFRVYAYGGLIGRIAAGKGKNCLAEDKGYPKYLSEDWLSKDDETDKKYLQYMDKKYIGLEYSGIEYSESVICRRLRGRLQEILDEPHDFYLDSTSHSAEYLDLILKAAEKKFMNKDKDLGERRIQTAIVKQHMKKASEDDWCVIDMEYKVSKKVNPSGKGFKPDIVIFDKNSGFGFIELKYGGKSMENLQEHYTDVQNIRNNNDAVRIITDELKRRSTYLWEYGLISDAIYRSMKKSDFQNLWQGFLFVGGKREKAISLVHRLGQKHGEIVKDEKCRFAFYPYNEENSIDKMKLDYQSMQTYESFIKE